MGKSANGQMGVVVHIDVGLSAQLAWVMGEEPSVDYLCGAQDGDGIKDSLEAIAAVGGYPAAASCGACKRIAELVHDGLTLRDARKRIMKAKPVSTER